MHRLKSLPAVLFLAFALGLMALAPTTSYAARTTEEDVYRENTDIQKIFHKLGRGIVNVLTGWVEIPKNVAQEWRETDPFTGTVLGLVKGVGWAVARTFAGFYEVISFPFPVPRNYEPIMEPEFILPTVWGERLPLFRDEFTGTGSSIDSAVDYNTANGSSVSGPSTTTRSY